jgi:protein-S-isoprenylcysteine O-methyltransferase Ste14
MKTIARMLVWLVFLVGGIWGGLSLDRILFPAVYGSLWFHAAGFLIGLGFLRLVMTVSRNTGRTLAKYGREGELPRMETNRLVTEGVYHYMRHPMHLGLLFFPFAFAFLAGSPSFVLMIAPAEIILILLLIKWMEEPEAIRKFGTEYLNYMHHTPWFCFKIDCLRELFKKVEKR